MGDYQPDGTLSPDSQFTQTYRRKSPRIVQSCCSLIWLDNYPASSCHFLHLPQVTCFPTVLSIYPKKQTTCPLKQKPTCPVLIWKKRKLKPSWDLKVFNRTRRLLEKKSNVRRPVGYVANDNQLNQACSRFTSASLESLFFLHTLCFSGELLVNSKESSSMCRGFRFP